MQKSSDKSKRKGTKNVAIRDKNSGEVRLPVAKSSGNFELELKALNPERKPLTMETLKTFEGFENKSDQELENEVCTIHTLSRIVCEYMMETTTNENNNILTKAA